MTAHPSFVQETPNIEPFLGAGLGEIGGKTTAHHHGGRARKDVRDLREAGGMHPAIIRDVGIDLRRNPFPCNIPMITA